eukprot:5814106-Pyramimonas_sp.AAC.1
MHQYDPDQLRSWIANPNHPQRSLDVHAGSRVRAGTRGRRHLQYMRPFVSPSTAWAVLAPGGR